MKYKINWVNIGRTGAYGFAIVFMYTFLVAYFGPTKTVIVDINHFHEAHIEFVMLLFFLPLILMAFWHDSKKGFRNEETASL